MATTFGKSNFNVSLKPTSAFPLDAREYFESYTDAFAAAQTAAMAGDATTIYYYGQVLRVVENGVAALYQIQPDNTLAPVGGGAALDAISGRMDTAEGKITALETKAGELETTQGTLLTKTTALETKSGELETAQGELSGKVTALETKTGELETAVGGIDDKIAVAIAAANHLKFKIAESKEVIDVNAELADTYIYLVAKTGEGDDVYDEYMIINDKVELIGHTKVDLTEYAKTADIEAAYVKKVEGSRLMTEAEGTILAGLSGELDKKVDKEDGKRLMTDAEGEKLSAMLTLKSVSAEFAVGEDGMLAVQAIDKSKVTGLADELDKKVDKVEGSRLITELEAQKIESLVLNDDGSVGISGKVNAENVQGLDTLLDGKVDKAEGARLMLDAEGTKLEGIEEGAQANKIEKVLLGTTELEIVDKAVAIPVAGSDLGVVKANAVENGIDIDENGAMNVHSLNVNKLVQTDGEDLILNGGNAQG